MNVRELLVSENALEKAALFAVGCCSVGTIGAAAGLAGVVAPGAALAGVLGAITLKSVLKDDLVRMKAYRAVLKRMRRKFILAYEADEKAITGVEQLLCGLLDDDDLFSIASLRNALTSESDVVAGLTAVSLGALEGRDDAFKPGNIGRDYAEEVLSSAFQQAIEQCPDFRQQAVLTVSEEALREVRISSRKIDNISRQLEAMDRHSLVSTLTPSIVRVLADRYLLKVPRLGTQRLDAALIDAIPDGRARARVSRNLELIAYEVTAAIDDEVARSSLDEGQAKRVCRAARAFFERHCTAGTILNAGADPRVFQAAYVEPFLAKNVDELDEAEKRTLRVSLIDSTKVLIAAVVEMREYSSDRSDWSVQHLNNLWNDIRALSQSLLAIAEVSKSESNGDDQEVERRYRDALMRSVDYLDLLGIDVASHLKRMPLQIGYATLSIARRDRSGDRTYPSIEQLFTSCARETSSPATILIRGDAGSGKSTLCRWLALQLCLGSELNTEPCQGVERAERQLFRQAAWGDRIPFLLLLRDLKSDVPTLDSFLSIVPGFMAPRGWMERVIQQGRAVLIVDGIDETLVENRDRVADWIVSLKVRYPACAFVVTSRPTAIPDPWPRLRDCVDASVNGLNQAQREALVALWFFAARHAAFSVGLDWKHLIQIEQSFAQELRRAHPLQRLAANPFLCSAMSALAVQRGGFVPEDGREVCEALISALLHRRDEEKRLSSSLSSSFVALRLPQKLTLFQELAVNMSVSGVSAIETSTAAKIIVAGSGQTMREPPTAQLVAEILERSGLVREARPGRLEFTHNTLRELLTADSLIEKNQTHEIKSRIANPDWHQIVRFAVSSRHQAAAGDVLEAVLGAAMAADGEVDRPFAYLALTAGITAGTLPRAAWESLLRLAQELLPPKNFEEAEAISFAGHAIVRNLAYHKTREESEAAACVRTLGLIGGDEAEAELINYVVDARVSVRRELLETINPLWIEEYRSTVASGKELPSDIASRVSDLKPIAIDTNVETLNLSHTRISDVGVLSRFKGLKTLDISSTRVFDASDLRHCVALERLDLSYTPVSDLAFASALLNLTWIGLDQAPIKDLTPLSALSLLDQIEARRTPGAEAYRPRKGQKLFVEN